MAHEASARTMIPAKSPPPARGRAARQAKPSRTAPGGTGRAATQCGRPVIELECEITVYQAGEEQGRWRAVWHENGDRHHTQTRPRRAA
jgi:hypothetical protein